VSLASFIPKELSRWLAGDVFQIMLWPMVFLFSYEAVKTLSCRPLGENKGVQAVLEFAIFLQNIPEMLPWLAISCREISFQA